MLLGVLSSCGDEGTTPGGNNDEPSGDAVTITFWNPITGPDASYMQELVRDFNDEYAGRFFVRADAQAEANHYQRILMLTIMIPGVINLIPTYSIVSALHLKNTVWALVLPGLGGVGNIFLIRQFMYTIPKQLDEAAFIDGAGHVRTFFSVVLPQLVPVLVTVDLFSFLGSWNDLLWPLIVMTDTSKRTLTAGLSVLQGQYDRRYASLMAATLVSAIPVMVIYLVAQKYLMQGISLTSGMKD